MTKIAAFSGDHRSMLAVWLGRATRRWVTSVSAGLMGAMGALLLFIFCFTTRERAVMEITSLSVGKQSTSVTQRSVDYSALLFYC